MYIIVGGKPLETYTGTRTFSALYILGKGETLEQVEALIDEEMINDCGGLICVINGKTGEIV